MTAGEAKLELQRILGIPESERFPNLGRKSQALWDALKAAENTVAWPLQKAAQHVRNINAAGVALVQHFESCLEPISHGRFRAYWDPTGKCWTIGWGHTGLQHKDGTVFEGRIITRAEADALFDYDMDQFERRVTALVKHPLTDDQFAALVSFDFNTGGLTLRTGEPSTLLRKLNAGDLTGAAAEFPKWNKSGGKVLRGLTRRRASERRLFLSEHPAIIPS